jgi:hypothetical protein
MCHVPHEARYLGRLKRGVKERKSEKRNPSPLGRMEANLRTLLAVHEDG